MPRPHIAMRKIRDVIRLSFGEQLSLNKVTAATGLPRSTANDYIRRAKAANLSWPLPEDLGDDELQAMLFPPIGEKRGRPEPDFAHVHRELRSHKEVTLELLWLEYKELYPEDGYSYTWFCNKYTAWKRHLDAVMRQDHRAGEKLFVDFAGKTIPIYDEKTFEISFEAELFVAVLGASSYVYAEAVRSQQLAQFVSAHTNCFESLGGCPHILVPDNLAAAVSKAHRYEPVINATYEDMAAHYGIAVIPARAYKPRDKAKAESGVLLAERWIIARLRHMRFTNLAELNEAIRDLLAWLNNRPFKKLAGSRQSLFEEIDRPALKPLPAERYELSVRRSARVALDYHVEGEDRHYYSVPYMLIGELTEVRSTAGTVEIFHKAKRVASHLRSYVAYRHSTDPAHMPPGHRCHASWTPERVANWAAKSGPSTKKLAEEIMAGRRHPEQGFRSCVGVIRLGERYGADRLEAACARALAARAHSYRSVESILRSGLDKVPLAPEPEQSHPSHENVRGPDYYA